MYFSQEYNIPQGGMQIYFSSFNRNLTNIKRKCLTWERESDIVSIPVKRGLFVVRIFTVFDARSPEPSFGTQGGKQEPDLHRYPGRPSAPAGAGFGREQAVSGVFFLKK